MRSTNRDILDNDIDKKGKMRKTIYDVTCPKCNSNDWYQYATDETEFSFDGTGHYYIDCHCNNCNNEWRQYYKFNYVVTEEWSIQ